MQAMPTAQEALRNSADSAIIRNDSIWEQFKLNDRVDSVHKSLEKVNK